MTFSSKIKDEYCSLPWGDLCCVRAEMMAALACSARFLSGKISISTAHAAYAARLSSMLNEIYATNVAISHGRELFTISVEDRRTYDEIIADLAESMEFETLRGTVGDNIFPDECCGRAFLRGVFLASGSVSEPGKAYHLEFTTRRLSVAMCIRGILQRDEIHSGLLKRSGYHVVYIKEGQQLSDFLLVTGAHNALLELESLMVDKSVRNSVNRVVNCDNANTVRIAYTGARQQEELEYLAANIGLDSLPEDLRIAAYARLEYPDLSLKELGEKLHPPLGKSGINHRLKKLEKLAKEHRECR
ncbi:MAG: DNA-binding protein WhiA [Saccharofermentanales bacterium]